MLDVRARDVLFTSAEFAALQKPTLPTRPRGQAFAFDGGMAAIQGSFQQIPARLIAQQQLTTITMSSSIQAC